MFLTFFTSTAIGRWLAGNAVKLIAALLVILFIVGCYLQYKHVEKERDDANQTIGAQAAQIAQQKRDILTLNDQIAKKQASEVVTTQTEAHVTQAQADIQTKYITVIKTVHDAVAAVEANPKLDDNQKAMADSQIYIDQLWISYCADTSNTSATCANYGPPPNTQPSVLANPVQQSQADEAPPTSVTQDNPSPDTAVVVTQTEQELDPNYT